MKERIIKIKTCSNMLKCLLPNEKNFNKEIFLMKKKILQRLFNYCLRLDTEQKTKCATRYSIIILQDQ